MSHSTNAKLSCLVLFSSTDHALIGSDVYAYDEPEAICKALLLLPKIERNYPDKVREMLKFIGFSDGSFIKVTRIHTGELVKYTLALPAKIIVHSGGGMHYIFNQNRWQDLEDLEDLDSFTESLNIRNDVLAHQD